MFKTTLINLFIGNTSFLEEMKQKSGADVKFDTNPSPVPGMKIVSIRGLPSQIEEAVRIISQKTGSKVCLFKDAHYKNMQ